MPEANHFWPRFQRSSQQGHAIGNPPIFFSNFCNADATGALPYVMMLTSLPLGAKTPRDYSDGTILARAAAGDDEALSTLIRQQEPRVYALARAILKQPDWAEDATQETFLRVVQQMPRVEASREEFDTWVLCITRNVALSLWRKRQVRGETGFENTAKLDEPVAGDAETSPLERAIAQEDLRRITGAIDTLPGPLREVLVLRFFHALDLSEIARVVGISAGNARVRLWRALDEVRQQLTETEGL